MASFKYPADNKIHATRPFVMDPGIGGDLTKVMVSSGVVSLSTSGATTSLGLSIPVGAMIVGCSAKIVTAIAGVSASSVTVALAFSGGNTLAVGNFVASGDGNVAANTKIKNLLGYASNSNLVTSSVADLTLTISGGADNTPSAGSIIATVHYVTLDNLD